MRFSVFSNVGQTKRLNFFKFCHILIFLTKFSELITSFLLYYLITSVAKDLLECSITCDNFNCIIAFLWSRLIFFNNISKSN